MSLREADAGKRADRSDDAGAWVKFAGLGDDLPSQGFEWPIRSNTMLCFKVLRR